MKTLKRVNVAIVGGGWTGLAMAKEITGRTSLSVLILERGAPRKTADYVEGMDELDYAIRVRLMQNIAQETITHRHSAGPVRSRPAVWFVSPSSGVGGAGEHWNGNSSRFLETQFVVATHLGKSSVRPTARKSGGSGLGRYLQRSRTPLLARGADAGVSGKAGNIRGQNRRAATFSRVLARANILPLSEDNLRRIAVQSGGKAGLSSSHGTRREPERDL